MSRPAWGVRRRLARSIVFATTGGAQHPLQLPVRRPKAKVKKEQYYKLYRDLPFMDGSGLSIKFALRVEIYVDGDLDTERAYTNVKFNSGLSEKLFDKPEGKPFEGAIKGKGPIDPPLPPEDPASTGSAPKHGEKRAAPKVIQVAPPPGTTSAISPDNPSQAEKK